MTAEEALHMARALLDAPTPLKRDCGRLCDRICCRPDETGKGGMLLFPGEEALYDHDPDFEVTGCDDIPSGRLITCLKPCDREKRPLSCRLFPLFPEPEGEQIHVRMDARAGAVCPLAGMGLRALSPTFVEAVRQAGKALMGDPEQRAFLERLSLGQEELRALKRAFRKEANPCTD